MDQERFAGLVTRSLRRVLLGAGAVAVLLLLCAAYARYIEPTWLRVKHVTLAPESAVRIIHISDLHFAGDTRYLTKLVATLNALDADLVCFTGDLIEDVAFLETALHDLATVNKPLYGLPGNHDRGELRSFDTVRDAFRATGGDWLTDNAVLVPSLRVVLTTLARVHEQTPAGWKRILLNHYPDAIQQIGDVQCDLILAGHTHGAQTGIPWLARHVLSFDTGTYHRGLYRTPHGPLYVNPGIGTFHLRLRFLCRPEVTVIEI